MKRVIRASLVISGGAILSSSVLINHYPANAAVFGFRLNAYGEYTGDNTYNFVDLGYLSGRFEGEDTNGDNEINANELSSFTVNWEGYTVPSFERNLNSGGVFNFKYILPTHSRPTHDNLYFVTYGPEPTGTGIAVDGIGITDFTFANIPGREPRFLPLRTNVTAALGGYEARSTYAPEVYPISYNPVPEPLTIFSSGMALGFGALIKKEYSRKQKKAKNLEKQNV